MRCLPEGWPQGPEGGGAGEGPREAAVDRVPASGSWAPTCWCPARGLHPPLQQGAALGWADGQRQGLDGVRSAWIALPRFPCLPEEL